MIICPNFRRELETRTHPWGKTEYKSDCTTATPGRYYNFIEHPELIPEVLEDFKPYDHREAVKRFYEFLKWINGPDSLLETNDCSLRPPSPHKDVLFREKLKIFGRVEFFRREQIYNTIREEKAFQWLTRMSCLYLQTTCPDFRHGLIEIKIKNTHFSQLPESDCGGYRISLNFNVYGDSEDEAFDRLSIVIGGIFQATKRLCVAMTASLIELW